MRTSASSGCAQPTPGMSRFERRYKNALLRMGGSEGGLAVRTEEKGEGAHALGPVGGLRERGGGSHERRDDRPCIGCISVRSRRRTQDALPYRLLRISASGPASRSPFDICIPTAALRWGCVRFDKEYSTIRECVARCDRLDGQRAVVDPTTGRNLRAAGTRSHRARVRQAPPPKGTLRIGVGYAVQRRPSPGIRTAGRVRKASYKP